MLTACTPRKAVHARGSQGIVDLPLHYGSSRLQGLLGNWLRHSLASVQARRVSEYGSLKKSFLYSWDSLRVTSGGTVVDLCHRSSLLTDAQCLRRYAPWENRCRKGKVVFSMCQLQIAHEISLICVSLWKGIFRRAKYEDQDVFHSFNPDLPV